MTLAYVFDIEGNGLAELNIDRKGSVLPACDTIHLLVLHNYHSDKVKVYRNNADENTIAEGWAELCKADVLIGHNILQYDLNVLGRLLGGRFKGRSFDTLAAARLLWPDAKHHPFGGNSVEAFGKLLNMPKVGTEIEDWTQWTPLMEKRCIQDCVVQKAIFNYLKPKLKPFRVSLKVEMRVHEIMARQQENGVTIDCEGAERLVEFMHLEQAECMDELAKAFEPRIEEMKTPAYYLVCNEDGDHQFPTKKAAGEAGYKGMQVKPGPLKTKTHPFNPGSAQQVADRLEERYGWVAPRTEPTPHCPEGNPSVTEEILGTLEFPEARLLARYNMAGKRLQHLRDWITRCRHGRTGNRIHPQINPLGCNTSRGSHQQPNQTACPKVHVNEDGPVKGFAGRYGWEMRSLWGPREGWVMVGGDASGLELRMLGHSLARWDSGAYAKEVVSGDIHTLNMQAGGLDTRDQTKTTGYGYLYGAGDEKIGTTIADHPSLSDEQRKKYKGKSRKKIGAAFRKKFQTKIPALGHLQHWCQQAASERGFIPLLDGRHAPCRSAHSAVNVKLQGDGAIIMKVAMCLLVIELEKRGWYMTRCAPMLWPHDEFQWESEPEIADDLGKLIVWSIIESGKRLKCKCPLDAEYKVGKNWAETH